MVTLPIHVKFLPPVMILWVICWIIENYDRIGESLSTEHPHIKLLLAFFIYYFWQAVGLIYTSDLNMGLSNLFGRLSLIVFPLVLFFPGEMIKSKIKTLQKIYIFSTLAYLIFCYGYAIYRSVDYDAGQWIFNPHPKDFWLNYFYGADLLINMHPSYFSIYALLALFMAIENFLDIENNTKSRIIWILVGLFLLISQYFISSRAGLLASIILIPSFLIFNLRKFAKRKYIGIIVIGSFLVLIPIIFKNQRFDYFFGKILNTKVDYERKEDPRIEIWESSLPLIQRNLLFGVGIGDVRSELVKEYQKIGADQMIQERYNAHNQYLEVIIENGIIGFMIFMYLLGYMFYISLNQRNLVYAFFILLICTFFIFETVLYRMAGIIFFSLFSFLLIHTNKKGNL
jgi:hypothetical protein